MTSPQKNAVVLFQLGGPDSLDAVEPFLYNLFSDPDIIDFPGAFVARRPLAKFIASRRSRKVAEQYRDIGGRSPIGELTSAQAQALQAELNKHLDAKVFVAMRYWHPFTSEAVESLKKDGFSRIILLPLYPQFSRATTISSFREWSRQCKIRKFNHPSVEQICCYHNHPLYIESIADNINAVYRKFSRPDPSDIYLVFSAHGVPASLIAGGDPYQLQIETTVSLVVEKGGWKSPHVLCFQSKVGPGEWLKPSLRTTMRELASKGAKHLLVIPIAFVTEHIETLHEINIEAREEARHLGIEQFEMMPALNNHPKFISCLSDLVLKKTAGQMIDLPGCRDLTKTGRPLPVLCPHWTRPSR